MTETFRLYSSASMDGATHLDLILAVYDALARDLGRIADAVLASDIEGRCSLSHHALLLLGYLETWVERLREPELEYSLRTFYACLRMRILRLQTSHDAAPFRELAHQICETRAAWQQKLAASSGKHTKPEAYVAMAVDAEASTGWSA